jgi:hypothetical protein
MERTWPHTRGVGVLIRFPVSRRARRSLAIFGDYVQVTDIERAESRLLWFSFATAVTVMGVLQFLISA